MSASLTNIIIFMSIFQLLEFKVKIKRRDQSFWRTALVFGELLLMVKG